MKKKAIISIIFILIIISAVFIAYKLAEKETYKEVIQTNTIKINNNVTINKTNTIIDETKINNNDIENNTEVKTSNDMKEEEENRKKAIEIVKENWGEDDTVTFMFDSMTENGRYVICVRDKQTTQALYWYTVEVKTGTFTIE